jgi:hypothetical protein
MTSIEFLILKLQIFKNTTVEEISSLLDIYEQAKEMHKQEIIDAYDKGEFDCGCNGTGEDYYNKTFKNQQ